MPSHALNPFVWDRPITDAANAISRSKLADQVARSLKSHTNVILFGQRGTGKTTFVYQLRAALLAPHSAEQVTMRMLYVDLDRAISWAAFEQVLARAMQADSYWRLIYHQVSDEVQTEMGVTIGSLAIKQTRSSRSAQSHMEIVGRLLDAIAASKQHVTVCFDEFQRLGSWSSQDMVAALGLIRSTLMGIEAADHVSVFITGSDRAGLKMLVENSRLPIFSQADPTELDAISFEEFFNHLSVAFTSTGFQITDDAIARILLLCRRHPRSVQRLASLLWDLGDRHDVHQLDIPHVMGAWQRLVMARSGEHPQLDQVLAQGGSARERERAVLYLVADLGGQGVISEVHAVRYGLTNRQMIPDTLKRLQEQLLVERTKTGWRVCDPILEGWLAANSPYATRRLDEPASPFELPPGEK